MKNKLILLFVVICVMTIAYADSVSDNMLLDSVKLYNSDGSQLLDFDSDTLTVYPGDYFKVQFNFDNQNNFTVHLDITSKLYLASETLKPNAKLDIASKDSDSAVIEFFVPEDEKVGYYDLDLRYDYNYNGTAYFNKTRLEVNIKKTVVTQVQKDELLQNLTKELASHYLVTNALLTTNYNCTYELAKCMKENGEKDNKEDFKTLYTEKCNAYDTCQNDLKSCISARDSKVSSDECVQKTQLATDTAMSTCKNRYFSWIIIIALLGVIGFMYWQKKKEPINNESANKSLRKFSY